MSAGELDDDRELAGDLDASIPPYRIVRGDSLGETPSRHDGFANAVMLDHQTSLLQNVVRVRATEGSCVPDHVVEVSETLVVLSGEYEVFSGDAVDVLGEGDLVHFPPGASHGFRCLSAGTYLAVFAPSALGGQAHSATADPDWLRTLYAAAWQQYAHEDSAVETRSNIYLALNAGLLALFTAAVLGYLRLGASEARPVLADALSIVLPVFCLGLGAFALDMCARWSKLIRAGERYVDLRWVNALAIEKAAGMEPLGLAHLESKWRGLGTDSGAPNEEDNLFVGSRHVAGMERHPIRRRLSMGNHEAKEALVTTVGNLWLLLSAAALVAFLRALLPS